MNSQARGIYQGIEYEYPPGTSICGETFTRKRWLELRSIVRALWILVVARRESDKCALLLYESSPIYIVLFYLVNRVFGMTFVQDKSEYRLVLHNKSSLGKIYASGYTYLAYRLFDEERSTWIDTIKEYSKIIQDWETLEELGSTFCRSKENEYLPILLRFNKIEGKLFRQGTACDFIAQKRDSAVLLNMLRCDVHREVSVKTLDERVSIGGH